MAGDAERAGGTPSCPAPIRVARLDELAAKGMMVVPGARCPLLVVHDGGRVFAVDNRCPHLGFPLHRGSVEDGILTCHWHHARFDLASGGTFDLWADDLATAAVEVRDGAVWVAANTAFADGGAHWRNRLRQGMEQNIGLVIAKAVLGRLAEGADHTSLVREAALFGVAQRDGWGAGLTILVALANIIPDLPEEETYLALFHGIRRVAEDCAGAEPRRARQKLTAAPRDPQVLQRWLRQWVRVRHRDGAERTLLTALADGASPARAAALLLTAATDRYFADGGHSLDFINKAMECLERIGWAHADAVLPAIVEQLATVRGAEETNSWRHPVDLVALCEAAFAALPEPPVSSAGWSGHAALAEAMLGEEPGAIVAALQAALAAGAAPTDLSRALAFAAAQRIARFGTANEFSDWVAAHHCFTWCNALDRMLRRIALDPAAVALAGPALWRGVFHGAMRIWLLRFLNVPPARLPARGEAPASLPAGASELAALFLATLDRQGAVGEAAQIAARFIDLGHDPAGLIVTFARALLREDADFHTYQLVEAGIRQYREWGGGAPGRLILIAIARYLAAHSPTERAQLQTADVARRLSRGQALHEAAEEGAAAPTPPPPAALSRGA